MSPEMKTLVYAMARRADDFGGPVFGFDVAKVRAELYALRHAEPSRADTDELIEILDWVFRAVEGYDGIPDSFGVVRRAP